MGTTNVGSEWTVLLQILDLLLSLLPISLAMGFRLCLCQAPPTLLFAIRVFSFARVDLWLESALIVKFFLN